MNWEKLFKLDAAFVIFKLAAHFSVYFDFMCYLRLENGNLIKNNWSKIESQCHADYMQVFELKIVQELSEKNVFKLPFIFPSILTLRVIYEMKTAI
jgi:hypothetical protein